MAATIKIDGTQHDLPTDLTFAETRMVKRTTGLLAGDIWSSLILGDNDGAFAYALVAMRRAEPERLESELAAYLEALPANKVEFDGLFEEEKPDPPAARGKGRAAASPSPEKS